MSLAQSKVTAQGQTSVPLKVRRKLGIGPGSVLEWEEQGETIIIRRAGRFSSKDIHQALFPKGVGTPRTLNDLKEGIRRHIKKQHASS